MANSYNGIYMGVVVSTDDPEHRYRAKIRVPSFYGVPGNYMSYIPDSELPWARPGLMQGSSKDGQRILPEKDAVVYVMFENGKLSKPVYLGCIPIAENNQSDQYDDNKIAYQSIFSKGDSQIIYQDGHLSIKDFDALPSLSLKSVSFHNKPYNSIFKNVTSTSWPNNEFSRSGGWVEHGDYNPLSSNNYIYYDVEGRREPVKLIYQDWMGRDVELEMEHVSSGLYKVQVPTSDFNTARSITFKTGWSDMRNFIINDDNSTVRINFQVSDVFTLLPGDELQIGLRRLSKSKKNHRERYRFRTFKRLVLTEDLIKEIRAKHGILSISLDYSDCYDLINRTQWAKDNKVPWMVRFLRKYDPKGSESLSSSIVTLQVTSTVSYSSSSVDYRYINIT